MSVYAGQEAVEHFREALGDFETEKGTIRIKHNQDFPFALIAELAKWCYDADEGETGPGKESIWIGRMKRG